MQIVQLPTGRMIYSRSYRSGRSRSYVRHYEMLAHSASYKIQAEETHATTYHTNHPAPTPQHDLGNTIYSR